MPPRKTNPAFLNGVPELLILELVARRPMYGYQLVQAIKAATGGRLEFGEGCVYPILHRLEAQQLLVASRESVSGRQRFVYRVTDKGTAQLAETVGAWQRVVAAINHALEGGERGHAAVA
ncbi:MAG: PadR family transcriptional regulator [Pirellulales bacterium]